MRRAPIFDTAELVEEAFYDAVQRGDLPGMMALWSTDDEVVCVHPGGARLVGLSAIRGAWEGIFANGGITVRPCRVVVHTGAVTAVHSLVEQIAVSSPIGNQVVECPVTNVYVKTGLGWRIVLHHGSPGGEVQTAAPADAVLH